MNIIVHYKLSFVSLDKILPHSIARYTCLCLNPFDEITQYLVYIFSKNKPKHLLKGISVKIMLFIDFFLLLNRQVYIHV